jgi:hypothetical protein
MKRIALFIRNKELPICSACVHFIEPENKNPYDRTPQNEGRCKKFGEVDLITGAINHDLAGDCRRNASLCGKSGSEYAKKL